MNPERASGQRDVLYLTYDGVLEPIGRSQVIPYLLGLARAGTRLHLVSFEKAEDLQVDSRLKDLEQLLELADIRWTRLRYHRRPRVVSTGVDVLWGIWIAFWRVHSARIQVVHARSYVPALMAVLLRWMTGVRIVFDMRGFWPEERVVLGTFRPAGLLYGLTKRFERLFLAESNRIIVLTRRAKELLLAHPESQLEASHIEVIPCCVDLRRFALPEPRHDLARTHDLLGRPVFANIGAISGRYLLPEMFRFLARLHKRLPEMRFLYLTLQDPAPLFPAAAREGFPRESLVVARAAPEEVPNWLSFVQFGVFFLTPGYVAQAACSIKLGEFLAAGVPVVTNGGVGDVDEILEETDLGVLLRDFSENELQSAVDRVTVSVPVSSERREACRMAARRHFDLSEGCDRYLSVYRALLGRELSCSPVARGQDL